MTTGSSSEDNNLCLALKTETKTLWPDSQSHSNIGTLEAQVDKGNRGVTKMGGSI